VRCRRRRRRRRRREEDTGRVDDHGNMSRSESASPVLELHIKN
jgi:hypothetical protein